jgi:hypothetical protein
VRRRGESPSAQARKRLGDGAAGKRRWAGRGGCRFGCCALFAMRPPPTSRRPHPAAALTPPPPSPRRRPHRAAAHTPLPRHPHCANAHSTFGPRQMPCRWGLGAPGPPRLNPPLPQRMPRLRRGGGRRGESRPPGAAAVPSSQRAEAAIGSAAAPTPPPSGPRPGAELVRQNPDGSSPPLPPLPPSLNPVGRPPPPGAVRAGL